MINTNMIEAYLVWKRDKELYPPQWTPEDWAKDVIMSEARVRIDLIKDLLETGEELDPAEFAVHVFRIVYDPLEELMNVGIPVGTSGEAQSMGQEESQGNPLL